MCEQNVYLLDPLQPQIRPLGKRYKKHIQSSLPGLQTCITEIKQALNGL